MLIKISRDSTGMVIWTEEADVEYDTYGNKCQFSDKKCKERGVDNIYDLVEDVLGQKLDVGEILTVDVHSLKVQLATPTEWIDKGEEL